MIEKQNTFIDTNGHNKIKYLTTINAINGYGKIRSTGIIYQSTFTAKNILKRLEISFAIRQNLLFKFEDKLMLLQTFKNILSPYFEDEPCGGMGIGTAINDINFYTKELPPSSNYKTFKSKKRLTYQMGCLINLSINLGKKQVTKLYSQIGFSPLILYGNQFKGGTDINYGIGILQVLDF